MTQQSRWLLATGFLLALIVVMQGCGSEEPPDPTPTATETSEVAGHQADASTKVCGGECIGPIMAAIDIIDGTGFHHMSERIGNAESMADVNPMFQGKVEHALAASRAAPWYGDLFEEGGAFETDARNLVKALDAGALEDAKGASSALHGSQHALSHAVYEWLGGLSGDTDYSDAVMAAQDIIDSTGFHGISEELDKAKSIEDANPRFAGKVEKALAVAGAVSWPEDLRTKAQSFQADATALADALEASDLQAAQEASKAVHSSQHDLSHATYEWLDTQRGSASGVGAVMAALDVIDTTGFHPMSEAIGEAESMDGVNPRFLGKVEKALTVARVVNWAENLQAEAQTFQEDAGALVAALEAGDLEGAKEASEAVHASAHALSHMGYMWLSYAAVGESNTSSVDEEAYADARVVEMEVRDWEWDPTTVRLQKGEPVVLSITNTGTMPHGIWIPELSVNRPTPPGMVTKVYLTPEKTGEFFLGCNNTMCGTGKQHSEMVATVVVTESGKLSESTPTPVPDTKATRTPAPSPTPTAQAEPEQGFAGLVAAALDALDAEDRQEAVSLLGEAADAAPSAHQKDEARQAAYRIRRGQSGARGLVEHLLEEAQ